MLTGEIRHQVDRVWNAFWTGGISNPLEVIEQITYLLFIKRLDDLQLQKESRARNLGEMLLDPIFGPDLQHLRWSRFKHREPREMHAIIEREVFPFIKNLGSDESTFALHMKDATFRLSPDKANVLNKVVAELDGIEMHDRDTKGDVYEYLLNKLATSGQNGQFRTPRHIIKLMVDMVAPRPDDTICDPACGTAGFLVACDEYLREQHPEILRTPALRHHYERHMFHGFDFDSTMLRIAAMNMMLHGIEHPDIRNRDSLAEQHSDALDAFSLILANPPFAGSLDYASTAKDLLEVVKTKKTELLFLALFLRILRPGGRAAVIVPDGVLFGSSRAHKELRTLIVDGHKLDAVVSMPSGVFKPYAGVSTAILFFTRTDSGGTDKVWFYDMQADGFSLDDKRQELGDSHVENNLPDILARWQARSAEQDRKRTEQSFLVPRDEIAANDYDLSINRYKEIVYEVIAYDSPLTILDDLAILEAEITQGMSELRELLG